MNKKKFQRQLDNALKSGSVTIYSVERFFKEDRKSFFNNEKIENLISENFASIVNGVGKGNIDTLIDTLYSHEGMREFLERDETIKYLLDSSEYYDFEAIVFDSALKDKAKEYIVNNFDYVVGNYSVKKMTPLYERMKFSDELKSKLDSYFEGKEEEFLRGVLTSTLSFKGNVDEKQLSDLVHLVKPLVDTALVREKCKITDTKVLRGGGYSNVLQIGDTVIKVGLPRKTFEIPNDKRILQPILRRDLRAEHGINAVIEVSDRVETDLVLSEDEMYKIYKDMRDRGIVCGDFKHGNIGRLIRDNTPRNNPENGMIGNVSETLEVGEYVILDTDFISSEGDPNIDLTSDMSSKFEKRYQSQVMNKSR